MLFTFKDAIADLRGDAPDFDFRIANEAPPASDYLFNSILPERNNADFSVSSGAMTIRPTMASLVAMDSPYPTAGNIDISTFLERTAKIAAEVPITEQASREMIKVARQLAVSGGNQTQAVIGNVLNFVEKVLVQPHIDTAEWLRGQALMYGAINWSFGNIELVVDYGIPAAHKFNTRTGTDGYGGSASKFWTDHRAAIRLLGYNYNGPYMHPDTMDMILLNDANNIRIAAKEGNMFTLERYREVQGNTVVSQDARDRVMVTIYPKQTEIIDPANPNQNIKVDFLEPGRIFYTGQGLPDAFRIGDGSTEDAYTGVEIGYTHVAPTVEGGGQPGRWASVDTPDNKPWQIRGQSVSNVLPVIENEEKLVTLSTEMA